MPSRCCTRKPRERGFRTNEERDMTTLRCNVELCLRIDGVGILIGGWAFQGDPRRLTATLQHGSRPPTDVASTWARLPRPDVVNHFKSEVTPEVCDSNRD